jgi:hypothetical protein
MFVKKNAIQGNTLSSRNFITKCTMPPRVKYTLPNLGLTNHKQKVTNIKKITKF